MPPLTPEHRHFLRLMRKDAGADGWVPVSAVLLPYVQAVPSELALVESLPDGTGRARITDTGRAVLEFS